MLSYKNNFIRFDAVESKAVLKSHNQVLPVLSVLIPTYGRTKILAETISSALSQSFKFSYEIIVVDNGSSNEDVALLTELIEGFNATNISLYSNEKNIGMVGNWNRCIEISRAEWLVILHDDDLMSYSMLDDLWRNRSNDSLVTSLTSTFEGEDSPNLFGDEGYASKSSFKSKKSDLIRRLNLSDVLKDVPLTASGTLLNKKSCIMLGGYDVDLWPHFDYLFSARYILKYGGIVVCKKILNYRLHNNSSSFPDVYIKFHRAKFAIRKSIVAEVLPDSALRPFLLRALTRVKWLEFYSEIMRYAKAVDKSNKKLDKYITIFGVPSLAERFFHKIERSVYPVWINFISFVIASSTLFECRSGEGMFLNFVDSE